MGDIKASFTDAGPWGFDRLLNTIRSKNTTVNVPRRANPQRPLPLPAEPDSAQCA